MRKVDCPRCGAKVELGFRSVNPVACQCGANLNIVARTVPIRIDPNREKADKLLKTFHLVGQWFIEQLAKRWRRGRWQIIVSENSQCANCQKEAKLVMMREDKKYCSKCGSNLLYLGSEARKELLAQAKKRFEIPRLTFYDLALRKAQSLFNRWLSDNWARFLELGQIESQLQLCKTKDSGQKNESEPEELAKVRETWRHLRAAMSPIDFFNLYYKGRPIRKSHRRERRERLKKLGKLTTLAFQVAEPICDGCEHLKEYQWGWECQLSRQKKRIRITQLPQFPKTTVQFPAGGYRIGKETVELGLWEKGVRDKAVIHPSEWLQKQGYEEFDSSKYPFLLRPFLKPDEYYLLYPPTEVVEVRPGDWTHFVAYGPTRTCVLSLNGQEDQKVRFFSHSRIVSLKEYFQAKSRKAKPGFKKRPRRREGRMVQNILHNEADDIADYLEGLPGKAVLLNMKKKKRQREDSPQERRKMNQLLAQWPDSVFRPLLLYRLELAGLIVKQAAFKAFEDTLCPYCKDKLEGTWQDLLLLQNKSNGLCLNCGKEFNLLLAMAKLASQKENELARG